jgi:hypothetical protein
VSSIVLAQPTHDYRVTCGHDKWADKDADEPYRQQTPYHTDKDDPDWNAGATPDQEGFDQIVEHIDDDRRRDCRN